MMETIGFLELNSIAKGIEVADIVLKTAARVGVSRYYDYEITGLITAEPSRVELPLRMHIGGPDAPLVSVGQSVTRGQLIASPNGMGANIHASIDGTVTAVTGDYIEIRK